VKSITQYLINCIYLFEMYPFRIDFLYERGIYSRDSHMELIGILTVQLFRILSFLLLLVIFDIHYFWYELLCSITGLLFYLCMVIVWNSSILCSLSRRQLFYILKFSWSLFSCYFQLFSWIKFIFYVTNCDILNCTIFWPSNIVYAEYWKCSSKYFYCNIME